MGKQLVEELIKKNYTNEKKVAKICVPLFECFPLIGFSYQLIINDKSMIALSSNTEWLKNFYEYSLDDLLFHDPHILTQKHYEWHTYWPLAFSPSVIQKLYKLNMNNTYTIVQKRNEFIEAWHFIADRDQPIISFFLNFGEIARHFVNYFNYKAADAFPSFQRKYRSAFTDFFILFQQERSEVNNEKKKIFFNETQIDQHIFKLPQGEVVLSARELVCLVHLVRGRTAKEIAQIIHLSPRTVEHYINIIKLKFNAQNKSELIKLVSKYLYKEDHSLIVSY